MRDRRHRDDGRAWSRTYRLCRTRRLWRLIMGGSAFFIGGLVIMDSARPLSLSYDLGVFFLALSEVAAVVMAVWLFGTMLHDVGDRITGRRPPT